MVSSWPHCRGRSQPEVISLKPGIQSTLRVAVTMTDSFIALCQLGLLLPTVDTRSVILIGPRHAGRFMVAVANEIPPLFSIRFSVAPSNCCGDRPNQYHPKFLMALLGSPAANAFTPNAWATLSGVSKFARLGQFAVPSVSFTTDEWTRRSMTLNAMRMSREFLDADSPRVLQLVNSRLQAGQRDVVHDVLVYLINQIEQMRESSFQARVLRADSIAAYLGVQADPVRSLLLSPRLDAAHIAAAINSRCAGPVRRALDLNDLVESQLALLTSELKATVAQERRVCKLIDLITSRLYQLVQ